MTQQITPEILNNLNDSSVMSKISPNSNGTLKFSQIKHEPFNIQENRNKIGLIHQNGNNFSKRLKTGKSPMVSAKVNDYRKNTKPLMEKRRRERINRSLEELKNLILDQTNHNPVRNHKLEKADILEMTVKHLRSLQKQKIADASSNDPSVMAKYKLGYAECVQECVRFMNNNGPSSNNMDPATRQRLLANLMRQFHALPSQNTIHPPPPPMVPPPPGQIPQMPIPTKAFPHHILHNFAIQQQNQFLASKSHQNEEYDNHNSSPIETQLNNSSVSLVSGAASPVEQSDDCTNSLNNSIKSNNTANNNNTNESNFRRSSVSPISATSSCSHSSSSSNNSCFSSSSSSTSLNGQKTIERKNQDENGNETTETGKSQPTAAIGMSNNHQNFLNAVAANFLSNQFGDELNNYVSNFPPNMLEAAIAAYHLNCFGNQVWRPW